MGDGSGSSFPTIISFFACAISLFPIPWQLKAKRLHIPTLSLAFWLAWGNFFQGLNTWFWRDNIVKKYIVYCEIYTYVKVASILALVCAALCTLRNLERTISPCMTLSTDSEIKRRNWFDFFMCWILPIVYAGGSLITASNQFNLWEGLGPNYSFWPSWVSISLYGLPPVYLSMINMTYSTLIVKWLFLHRGRVSKFLHESNDSMSLSQFIRLLTISVVLSTSTMAFALWQLQLISGQMQPFQSWDYAHYQFDAIYQFPTALLNDLQQRSVWIAWSIYPFGAFMFFLMFGIHEEVREDCRKCWRSVKSLVVPSRITTKNTTANSGFVSLDSLSDSYRMDRFPPKKSAKDRWLAGDDLDFRFDEAEEEDTVRGAYQRDLRHSRGLSGSTYNSQTSFGLTSYGTVHATQ